MVYGISNDFVLHLALPPFLLPLPSLPPSFPLLWPTQVNMLVTELKSEALKERHWKQLMKRLRVMWQLHDLTLGQVLEWDGTTR